MCPTGRCLLLINLSGRLLLPTFPAPRLASRDASGLRLLAGLEALVNRVGA